MAKSILKRQENRSVAIRIITDNITAFQTRWVTYFIAVFNLFLFSSCLFTLTCALMTKKVNWFPYRKHWRFLCQSNIDAAGESSFSPGELPSGESTFARIDRLPIKPLLLSETVGWPRLQRRSCPWSQLLNICWGMLPLVYDTPLLRRARVRINRISLQQ